MTEYVYKNITESPNISTYNEFHELISGIHYDVQESTMTDKSLVGCDWFQKTAELKVYFENELSAEDKTKLDQIIQDNT
jgi:hypothetical protein